MSDLDDQIRSELKAADAEWLKSLQEEPSFFSLVSSTFHGRNRWHTILGFVQLVVLTLVCVLCAVQFFGAPTIEVKLAWSTGFLLTAQAIALIKVWLGMTIIKNHILREIKRVELQVARLEKRPTP